MRDMKWHILNTYDDAPLCWGDRCIEFDTEADARKFYDSMSYAKKIDAYIKECIMYYDGGHVNLTGYTEDKVWSELANVHNSFYDELTRIEAEADSPIVRLALDDYKQFIGELTI